MTIAKNRVMTLEEYLAYDDGTEARYELIDGIIVEMGAEADINILIEGFLFSVFLKFVPHYCIRRGTEIVVEGNYANTRIPDLMVLTEAGDLALDAKKRSIVMLDMPAPALVVEVVSSSTTNKESRDRDYHRKRSEYAQRGIAEYWLVDPMADCVLFLSLQGDRYTEQKYTGKQRLVSATFPEMELTAKALLNAGRP